MIIRSELGERDKGQKLVVDCRIKCPKTGKLVQDDARTAKQSEAAACDINNIMIRWLKTGQLPNLIRSDARYGDFADAPTYQEAMEVVAKANEQFMALDAKVREKFDNDPVKMLEFVNDPNNGDALVKMGLALPKQAQVSVPAGAAPQGAAAVSTTNPAQTGGRSGQSQEGSSAAGA